MPAGISVRVTGVFCHQTPMARFSYRGTKARRELADLLVVHDHLTPRPRRRALLLQAKMATSGVPIGSIDKRQLYLYDGWPRFTLHGRAGTKHQARFLSGARQLLPSPAGASFALVERYSPRLATKHRSKAPSVWSIARPHQVTSGPSRDFADYLTSMVLGKIGSGRDATPLTPVKMSHQSNSMAIAPNSPLSHHWSVTIQELLNLTASRCLPARNRGPLSHQRGMSFEWVQHGSLSTGQGVGDQFGRSPRPPEPATEEPPNGVSLLMIETSGETFR